MDIINLLGIVQETVTKEKVVLSMEVKEEHCQPFGIMHGGVSAVLAETAASLGALENAEEGRIPVGMDIHSRHVKSVAKGRLTVEAEPVSIGRTVQVWEVTITDDRERVISHSTCSLMMIERKG